MNISTPLAFNGSRLSTFRDCQEKDRLRYVEHLVPKRKEAKRSFGTAFHAAIETYHNTGSTDDAERAFVEIAREADLPLDMEENAEPRTIERGIALFHAYLERWRNEPFKILRDKNGKPMVEIRANIHLFDYRGFPIIYTGVIDKIVEASRRIYIPDLKTTRRGLAQFQHSMRPNNTLTGYYVLAKSILGDSVFAVGYDAVFISSRKPNPKKGGWWAHGIDIEKDFMRTYTTRSPIDVEVWLRSTTRTVMQIIRLIEEGDEAPWDQNAPAACRRYGPCDYLEVCNTNRDKAVIDNFYDREEWHTLAEAKEDAAENGEDVRNED